MTLRRYRLKLDDRGWDWAHIVIGADGYFSSVSSYGNYAFGWWHHGRDDFRRFLIGIEPDYAYRKLFNGDDPYDGDATLAGVKQHILDERRAGHLSREQAREEWDLLEEHEHLDNDQAFNDWARATSIGDVWEFWCEGRDRDAWAFCTRVLPKLAEVLRAELAAERDAPKVAP